MGYLGTKPANAVITSEQIGDGAVQTADIANSAVTDAKIASMAGSKLTGGQSIPKAALPTGSVIQVVSTTTSTSTGTTSGSYVDTALTLAITPNFSTSKILVLVSGTLQTQADNRTAGALGIKRNSTLVYDDQRAIDDGVNANVAIGTRASLLYLDSPATTSSTTYTVQLARAISAGTSYSVTFPSNSSIATIALLEIAA